MVVGRWTKRRRRRREGTVRGTSLAPGATADHTVQYHATTQQESTEAVPAQQCTWRQPLLSFRLFPACPGQRLWSRLKNREYLRIFRLYLVLRSHTISPKCLIEKRYHHTTIYINQKDRQQYLKSLSWDFFRFKDIIAVMSWQCYTYTGADQ